MKLTFTVQLFDDHLRIHNIHHISWRPHSRHPSLGRSAGDSAVILLRSSHSCSSAYVCPHQAPTNKPLHRTAANSAKRIASLVVYLLGLRLLSSNFVLIFIVTILLLAMDFYYLKNIAGRRLVGLRWWNEVDANTGDGRWVFESADPETRDINATDKRFFWLALYAQPVLWIVLAIVALVSLQFIWLTLVGELISSCIWRSDRSIGT